LEFRTVRLAPRIIATVAIVAAAGLVALLWPPTPRDAAPADAARVDWAAAIAALSQEGFARPPGDRPIALPADHGAHPEARMESWTLVAHLADETGADVALHLSWLRLGLVPPERRDPQRPWAPAAFWRAHVALTDSGAGAAIAEERFSRGALGAAGHDATAGAIWLDDWRLGYGERADGERLDVAVTVEGAPLTLSLRPVKPPLAPEAERDAPARGYALTRLDADGALGAGETRRALTGVAWLEHGWGELPPPGGPVARDRLLAHLDDGSEIALTRTRRRGGGAPILDGVAVDAEGGARQLDAATLALEATEIWRDAAGAPWPTAWRLDAPQGALRATPLREDQRRAFLQPVWIGAARLDGAPGSGRATILITDPTEQ
jgi:predicted secreted hydrolase